MPCAYKLLYIYLHSTNLHDNSDDLWLDVAAKQSFTVTAAGEHFQ